MFLTQSLKSDYSTNHVVNAINNYNFCKVEYKQKCNNCFKRNRIKSNLKSYVLISNINNIELIKKVSEQYGLPYDGVLWLWLRESGCGTSRGAKVDNIHFGVKCHGKKGVAYKDDCKGKCCFVSYPNFESSLKDLMVFFTQNKRYEKAGLFEAKTAEQFAIALKKAKYATDPNFLKNFYNEYPKLMKQ